MNLFFKNRKDWYFDVYPHKNFAYFHLMPIAFDWLKKNLYKLTFKCLSSEKSNFHKQISVINFSNILNFPYHLLNNSLGYCLLPVYLFITHEKFASESSSLLKAITLRIFSFEYFFQAYQLFLQVFTEKT